MLTELYCTNNGLNVEVSPLHVSLLKELTGHQHCHPLLDLPWLGDCGNVTCCHHHPSVNAQI